MMTKTAGLFSGQGAQYVGMGKKLYDTYPAAKAVYDLGSEVLGLNLAALSFCGTQESLNETINAQPAIFAHSVAAYTASLEFIPPPVVVSGHSLGELAALYAAGAYSLEDGFKIVKARAEAMDKVSRGSSGAMAAVMGVDYPTLAALCKEVGGFVVPVNLNLPTQTVISGKTEDIDKTIAIISKNYPKAKVVKLAVSSAFHTSMMNPAAEELSIAVKDIAFNPTKIPFVSNLTGDFLQPESYPDYLKAQMVSPVLFTKQVETMTTFGVTNAIEFGPGKTVATLVKKNNRAISVSNVDDTISFYSPS